MPEMVKVVRVRLDVNLRSVHALRERLAPKLKRGEAALLLNTARDKARLIDCMGGVHNYYTDNGEKYDARLIQQQVQAFRLRLALPAGVAWDSRGAVRKKATA